MKQKRRTLKSAIASVPAKTVKPFGNDKKPEWIDTFYSLSFKEQLKLSNSCSSYTEFVATNFNGVLKCARRDYFVHRNGRRCYILKKYVPFLTIRNNSIYDYRPNELSSVNIDFICELFGIKMVLPYDRLYLINKQILKSIICNTIYNDETLYKRIGRMNFQLKNFEWKELREFIKISPMGLSIADLRDFTVDFNNSIRVINRMYNKSSNFSLIRDILDCAVKLDEKINLNWSLKRMTDEHNRQIAELNREKIEKLEQIDIFPNDEIFPKEYKLLNTELDIYNESQFMSNCLYRCYFSAINNGDYIAFHYNTSSVIATVGFTYENEKLVFDQAYGPHNAFLPDEVLESILEFGRSFESPIMKLLKERRKPVESPLSTNPQIVYPMVNMRMEEDDLVF